MLGHNVGTYCNISRTFTAFWSDNVRCPTVISTTELSWWAMSESFLTYFIASWLCRKGTVVLVASFLSFSFFLSLLTLLCCLFMTEDLRIKNSFLVLQTGAITKWRNTKDWKDTEQWPHRKTKANQQGVKHQEYPDKGRGRAFLSFFSNDIIIEQNRFIKMNQQSC